jgi:hypothetical protein
MRALELKPTHKPVQNFYAALRQFEDLNESESGRHSQCVPVG